MAVYPDRIVLKNSTDGPAAVITAIESGGTDEIQQGEIVLSREPGKVEIYTVDSAGNIVAVKGVETLDGLTDVTITSPTTNDYLRYNGSQWVNVASTFYDVAQDAGDFDTGTTDLTQTIFDWFDISVTAHSDVDTVTTAPQIGEGLVWDGTNWVPGTVAGSPIGLDGLTDVTITTPSTGQILEYNGSAWVNVANSGGGATAIDDLTDVDTSTVAPTDGQVLTWDNAAGQWEPADAAAGSTTLAALTDTNITSPATGEYLRYSSGTWRDLALDISDDPFPNLGNDLNTSGYSITDSAGNNIKIAPVQGALEVFGHPSATSHVGKIKINCEQNTHGVTIQSPPHSAGATYSLTLPTSAGANGEVLTTDGTGVLSWSAGGGGGGALNDLSDVTITAAATGEVLRYNGSSWVDAQLAYTDLSGTPTNLSQFTNDVNFITGITGEVLGDLSNVVLSGATSGDVLSYNGTNWVNSAAPPADISGSSIGQLNDVDTTTSAPVNGEALVWNSTSGNWEPSTVSVVGSIDDLSDVDTTTSAPTTGQILEWDGANWVPANNSGGGGATSIDDLTDVDTTTAAPSLGQVLKWDGANWIPGNDNTGGGGSATLGRGDGGDLDFGTVDSAFVFAVYGGGDLDTTTEDKPVEFVSYDVDGGELT